MAVNLDVVIDVHPSVAPLGVDIALGGPVS